MDPKISPNKKDESQEVKQILEKQETSVAPVEWQKYDSLNHSLARYFSVESESERFQKKIDTIKEWAKLNAKSQEKVDLLWAIRSLENRLGTPPMGEKRITHVYRWIRLETDRKQIEEEQKLLERRLEASVNEA